MRNNSMNTQALIEQLRRLHILEEEILASTVGG
jgi:hypothetical protein